MSEHQRIEIGTAGMGEVGDATIEQRARQIAHLEGREEVNELDRQEALREIVDPLRERVGDEEQIPEVERPGTGEVPGSATERAPRFDLDDEANMPENLVREGVEEADFDTRVSAADEAES